MILLKPPKSPSTKRTYNKNEFEKSAWQDKKFICGIDEVGRGSLAGPLLAAAAILPVNTDNPQLKDSKILTPDQREEAYAWLIKNAWFGVGIVTHRFIDTHGIWQATLAAMKQAFIHAQLASPHSTSLVLVDAMPLKLHKVGNHAIPIISFAKADDLSISVAAASIVAKVTRDRLMKRIDLLFPNYHLAQHKGYATAKHTDAIAHNGISIIHRHSFLRKRVLALTYKGSHEQQRSLW